MMRKICIEVVLPALTVVSRYTHAIGTDHLLVDDETNKTSCCKTADDSQRKCRGWKTDANAANEDDSFQAFSQHCDLYGNVSFLHPTSISVDVPMAV